MATQLLARQLLSGAMSISLLLTIPFTIPCYASASNQTQSQQIHVTPAVRFETPAGFSELQPLGRGTLGVVYPAAALADHSQFVIRLAVLEGSSAFSFLDAQELLSYVKYSFLGLNAPSQGWQRRQVWGQVIQGEILMQPSHRGMFTTELYVVPLSSGRQLILAFEADTQLPLRQVETVITTVITTLVEVPQDN